ncbi:MAG: transcription-repair coupling factor [Chlorobiales bacterium]|nr:transcription-repair coupling factor [Chlorobiales bacterium]
MKNGVATDHHLKVEVEKFSISSLIDKVASTEKVQLLAGACKAGRQVVTASGLCGSMPAFVVANLFRKLEKPLMVVCSEEGYDLYQNDLDILLGPGNLRDNVAEPSLALSSLMAAERKVVLTTPIELQRKVVSKELAQNRQVTVVRGAAFGYDKLVDFLANNGFDRKDFVEEQGDFAVRGSIVDVFSYGEHHPIRFEFFGDEVDSIRYFDLNSQLSLEHIPEIKVISNLVGESADAKTDSNNSLLDYLPPDCLVIIDGYDTLKFEDADAGVIEEDAIRKKIDGYSQLRFNRLKGKGEIDFEAMPMPKFNSNFKLFSGHVRQSFGSGRQIVFASKSKKELGELSEFITAEPLEDGRGDSENLPAVEDLILYATPESLYEGFVFNGICLYTESDVFGKLHSHKQYRRRHHRKISLRELRSLNVGDYIVHEDYGIGVFMGMEKTKVGGSEQECVLVHYDKGDKLFVNIQNIHLLSKYSSAEGRTPTLSRLGSGKWEANKEKVKKRLKDIARNLISLYAKRKMTKGFAFKTDTIWQREFDAAFIFEETPDQESAIQAVKTDLQAEAPMDRLICGDAGFGKTEVAMRAAFKAVESGKQVAVLVPTTVLAHQHYNTFKLRFQNFPMRVEVLSRFVSRQQQKEIIRDINDGKVDVVIGTHRIISKDVMFKDLGLLIIDEEQHFGVGAKEKLREDFPTVDSLTLSATPIPRTLQFSMMGARDLSIMSTPPKNRQPVETVVQEFDIELIRQAIGREIGRGGQVFFLHNRIASISEMYELIKKLFPKARVGVAHGQMPAKDLEAVMLDFIQKELDVLVSTAIVGSGLDISNANTIIINRAELFGLSDLYQLRGRVGRSDRKAYSYLLTPPLSTLNKEGLQRLAVIESFTELGSGFNVAMRDLDIRGAGNLLGAEQSGFIFDLGFEVYQKILEEAVLELKSTEFQNIFAEADRLKLMPKKPCEVIIFFDALIPSYYVESASERFSLYERLSKAETAESLDKLQTELNDRFGRMPDECRHLFEIGRLRLLGTELELQRIEISETKVTLILPEGDHQEFYSGKIFEAFLKAVQSDWLQAYRPQFKNEKKLKIALSFEEPLKHRPDKALKSVGEVLAKIMETV